MNKHVFWLPAIAILGLLGTISISPALARGGGSGGGGGGGGGGGMFRSGPAFSGRVPTVTVRRNAVPRRNTVTRRNVVTRGTVMARGHVVGPPFYRYGMGTRDYFGQHRRGGSQYGSQYFWPLGIWPFGAPYTPTLIAVPETGSEISSSPAVIVIAAPPAGPPEQAVPEAPQDFSYVKGCHAIPNGYHCDVPQNQPVTH
jgi:hypothetical protein